MSTKEESTMLKTNFFILIASVLVGLPAYAHVIKVVASTSDIADLANIVGGADVKTVAIAKGTQDPHYIEAKPSFMVNVRDADLLVVNGLSLEIGWIPSLVKGARNPSVNPGSPGYLELGSLIEPIDLPTGNVTRAMGDVHPDGNPHFTLDPVRIGDLALKLADKLASIDPAHKDGFVSRATAYKNMLTEKTAAWQARIAKLTNKKVITYHPSMNYFMNRFGLTVPTYVETKPGIPPTAQHILEVISLMKREGIKLILVDNFFDTKVAERISKDVPGSKVASVGIAVGSTPQLKSLFDVTEQLVKVIEANQ
jgi:zinc/manganese transport system substrate-binding protein